MSKTPTKDIVATAIIEQISTYSATSGKNYRSLTWRMDTAKAILGIKDKAAKPIVKAKTADQLQSEIIAALTATVKNAGVRKLQSIIKGETSLNEVVAHIATTITTPAVVATPTEADYQALLSQMTTDNLFEMLRACSTCAPIATKATKAAPARAKGGYTSVDDKTAYTIAAVYLAHYLNDKREGNRTFAPECFLGKRCANATMALRRFLYSTICRDNCAIHNSMPVAVAEWYKANPYKVAPHAGDKTYNPEKDLANLFAQDSSLREMVEGWKDEPYIAAVLKK